MAESAVDLTRGIYRRVYGGFITGRRINAVSIEAEAWFWRLLVLADDYGNLVADPDLLPQQAGGRRKINHVDAERWTKELADIGLIRVYSAGGERCIAVDGFMITQPAGKNGRRIQRAPAESSTNPGNPRESKGILDNPGELVPPNPIPIPIPNPTPTPTNGCARIPTPLHACTGIVKLYPKHRQGTPREAALAVQQALDRIAVDDQHPGHADPYRWLQDRVRTFAGSHAAKGRYCKSAVHWFDGDGFDAPPESWQPAPDTDNDHPAIDLEAVRKRRAERETNGQP